QRAGAGWLVMCGAPPRGHPATAQRARLTSGDPQITPPPAARGWADRCRRPPARRADGPSACVPSTSRGKAVEVDGTTDLPEVATLAELRELIAPDVFLRFSRGPDHDRGRRSTDYESGLDLPGLSV